MALDRVVRALDVVYARQGEGVLEVGRKSAYLYLVRSGAAGLRDDAGRRVDQIGEGGAFGYPSLLADAPAARRQLRALRAPPHDALAAAELFLAQAAHLSRGGPLPLS